MSGRLRIAHFSDVHVLSVRGAGPRDFLNKRWTGAVNLALNRAKHYRVEIFEQLLRAVKAAGVDHTICTGDLVNLALEPEFQAVEERLRATFAPDELTVVPGNHDCYVKDAARAARFERHFADWLPHDLDVGGGDYPVTRLREGLAVVGLSTAAPTPVFLATGRVGPPQRAALGRALAHPALAGRFRVVALHHPLLPDPQGRRLEITRSLLDAADLMDTLRAARPTADLVIHGHNHGYARQVLPGTTIPILQVASGSRHPGGHPERAARKAPAHAEFNVYGVDDGALVSVERYVHDPATGAFTPRREPQTRAAG